MYLKMEDYSELFAGIDTEPASEEDLAADQVELEARLGSALGAGYTHGRMTIESSLQPRDLDFLYRCYLGRIGYPAQARS